MDFRDHANSRVLIVDDQRGIHRLVAIIAATGLKKHNLPVSH